MKVGILAGGRGTRLAEETEIRPKPMVEIGGHPILWHIMKQYSHFGFEEFVVALGYKSGYIKRFFTEYTSLEGHLSVDLGSGEVVADRPPDGEKWRIELIDTGRWTNTGGRIKRIGPYLGDETFMLTWGDGVSNVDLNGLLDFHRSHGKLATVTAVRPPARFGRLELDGDTVLHFSEKPQLEAGWINGAFFVLEPEVLDFIEGDSTQFEHEPLSQLAEAKQLVAYRHDGFWQCMDTVRDKKLLQELWEEEAAPWKVWA